MVADEDQVDRAALLGQDYWLVLSTPEPDTTAEDIASHVDSHLAWVLDLERSGIVFLSGPLTSGRDVLPGSGVTVLRAGTAEEALEIARADPFVVAGLRTVEVFGWRLNEGSVQVRISLGRGSFTWG
jgi:uncharacterized protein